MYWDKTITIIGTQGVGKSTLFRKLIRLYSPTKDQKIISPIINYTEGRIEIEGQSYKLIDTPPLSLSPHSEIEKEIKQSIEELVKKSDLIIWVIKQADEEVLLINQRYAKRSLVPWILLFNSESNLENAYFGQSLAPEHFFNFPLFQTTNYDRLVKTITQLIPSLTSKSPPPQSTKRTSLLIFGPPNSGKSTLMNYLLQENRSLTTPIAGTTQEPVISQWNWKNIDFQLVDTAGITKEKKLKETAWKNCDLAWAVIDATQPLTKQILQIINLGEKRQKPLVIVINKCDLETDQKILQVELKNRLKSLRFVPIVYISALKGNGINSLLKIMKEMITQSGQKLTKKQLTETVEKMINNNPPKYFKGNRLKIYFAKQESGLVHYFIFFVNNSRWVHFSYQRYMVNYLRQNLGLTHLPIKIIFRASA